MGRKVIFTAIGLGILCLAFTGLLLKGLMTDGIFIAWLGAIIGLIGVYTTGNVMSKKVYNENEKAKGSADTPSG